jgi:hypothetical protein
MCEKIGSLLIVLGTVLRLLPLFLASSPKTPLRVLCIMAFDTLHMLRYATRLSRPTVRTLAALLDLGACANAGFDDKRSCPGQYQRSWQLLEAAGFGPSAAEYLRRLAELEHHRPAAGGGDGQFQLVLRYREDVVRLSLAMVFTTAVGRQGLDEAIRETRCEPDLNLLFRIVMQCQIIDDTLDYAHDLSGRLPSFLTASQSLDRACELTRQAADGYADMGGTRRRDDLFPLRLALFAVSILARLVLCFRRLATEPVPSTGDGRHGYTRRYV